MRSVVRAGRKKWQGAGAGANYFPFSCPFSFSLSPSPVRVVLGVVLGVVSFVPTLALGAGVGLAVKWHALGYKMAWLLGLYNMLLFLVICEMARSQVRVCCKK